jgi:3-deoxy-manno-octulosonate cytidylyltransferase (CMP-KDO synthetase)
MKVLGVIPARFASTRFPGKPLVSIEGKSMIRRVYEQASKAKILDRLVVATDDSRIFDHVKEFGGEVVMTSPDHQNGSSRCHEVLQILSRTDKSIKFDVVINIQGDEPFINPAQINKVASVFNEASVEIGTLAKKITKKEELFNSNSVKVMFGQQKFAIYFSRQAIPFLRDVPENEWVNRFDFYKHIGIYAYRAKALGNIVKLKPSKLEEAEKLEQLRWLENGYRIAVEITEFEGVSIDTPDDLSKLTNRS